MQIRTFFMSTANMVDNKQYTSQVIQVRLYPNKDQQNYLTNCFGCCRYLYNHFLYETTEQYKIDGTFLWYEDFQNALPEMKKQEEYLITIILCICFQPKNLKI